MAIASSLHFAGYELARNAIMALFTSERTGFPSPSAVPIATACVSPFSFLLLWVYTRSLHRSGPRRSLRYTTMIFALMLGLGAGVIRLLDDSLNENELFQALSRTIIFLLNVGSNGFVQLLYTQHWSFLGSICKKEGAVWFAPIAGLGSVASTAAAVAVSPLVDNIGLTGLLLSSSLFLFASSSFADDAYRIAHVVSSSPWLQCTGFGDACRCPRLCISLRLS